jgi:hypothetical protein
MVQTMEVMSRERIDRYVSEAAKAAGYEEGFGVMGCDLTRNHWWAARKGMRHSCHQPCHR